jgi:predicted ATPase
MLEVWFPCHQDAPEMLSRFYADNFRCFSGFEFGTEAISVLLGANGSGKSSFISVLVKLRDFIVGRGTSLEIFPSETLTRWNSETEQTFELAVRHDLGEYVYRLRISHVPAQANNKVMEESVKLNGQPLYISDDKRIQLYNDSYSKFAELLPDWHVSGLSRVHERNDNKRLILFRRFLEGTLVLALNPALVSAVSSEKQPVTMPKPDCSDFAGWLRHIMAAEPLVRQEAEQNLANGGLPGFRAFADEPSGDARIMKCIFESPSSRFKLRLDELSSGQIAMVILETALAVANNERDADYPKSILILDEPGNFLGIPEIQPLLSRLQDAAQERRFQVILTAHHPIAIDFLAATHGFWLEREPGRHTRVQRIQAPEDIREGTSGLRISDLVARGWLSELGIDTKSVADVPEPQT